MTDVETVAPPGQSYHPADTSQDLVELALGDLLRAAAAEAPDRIFLVDGTVDGEERTRLTYAEVLARSERLAAFLRERFGPQDNIAIWAPNSLEWIIVEFGAALAGIPLVMVNPALRRDELSYILSQSRAAGLFFADRYRDNVMSEIVADVRAELPGLRETFLLESLSNYTARDPDAPAAAVSPHLPVMIQYTSGTTGTPKGAVLTHFSVVNNARLVQARLGLPPHSAWLVSVPMFHSGGSVFHLLCTLWNRGTLVVMRQFDPAVFLELVEQEKVNFFSTVPTGHLRIVEHPAFSSERVASLVCVGSGGTTVPEELVRRLERDYGAAFVVTFGQTESSASITHAFRGDSIDQKALTVGYPLPHLEIKVIDAERRVVPRGAPGEICVRGFCVMREYFDMPRQTAETIDQEGWLHTGDIGVLRPDGYVQITGRLKEMIIRGGENIFPREIEDLLSAHADVAEAAVIGLPDREWGEQVAAVVRLNAGADISEEALQQYLGERIARYKVPRYWSFVDSFPQTASGKIQKFLLRDLFGKQP